MHGLFLVHPFDITLTDFLIFGYPYVPGVSTAWFGYAVLLSVGTVSLLKLYLGFLLLFMRVWICNVLSDVGVRVTLTS